MTTDATTCSICGQPFAPCSPRMWGPEVAFGRELLAGGQAAHVRCRMNAWRRLRIETFGEQYARRILALRWAYQQAHDESTAVFFNGDARLREEQRAELRVIADELRGMLEYAEAEAKP